MKFKTNDDVILHYTDTGDEDKPALIGIPGIGGSCQMWQDLIALFKNPKVFSTILLNFKISGSR